MGFWFWFRKRQERPVELAHLSALHLLGDQHVVVRRLPGSQDDE